jgi:thioredoxin-dependent peroxiredoxin
MMKFVYAFSALLALALPAQVSASLPVGATAPAFSTQAAKGGKAHGFNLQTALARGPVVLYFYPKAFTQGCTLEARAFAEAIGEFEAAGATVIGMSADDIETLKRFSTEECGSKFPVGVATARIIEAYDVTLKREGMPAGMSDRTSYVIGQDGKIAFVHSDLDWRDHVRLTLAAVQSLKRN